MSMTSGDVLKYTPCTDLQPRTYRRRGCAATPEYALWMIRLRGLRAGGSVRTSIFAYEEARRRGKAFPLSDYPHLTCRNRAILTRIHPVRIIAALLRPRRFTHLHRGLTSHFIGKPS